MYILFTIVHVMVCVFLIIVVLLQSGKAADLAGAFGGMGSQTAFGPRGSATLLSKATTISAVVFMITSLGLSILATRSGATGSAVGSTVLEKQGTVQTAPAQKNQAPAQAPVTVPGSPAGQPSVTLGPEGQGTAVPLDVPKNAPPAPEPAPGKKK